MKHSKIRETLAAGIVTVVEDKNGLPMKPRPYQLEALMAVRKWLSDKKASRRAYISHATGLGKTMLFSSLVVASKGLRTLLVVPTKILLEQTARTLAEFTGGIIGHQSSLSRIFDESGEVIAIRGSDHSDVVVTTNASFCRDPTRFSDFDPHLIIVDECHGAYTEAAQEGIALFSNAVILGLSATPDYLVPVCRPGYVSAKMENGQTLYVHPDRLARAHFGTKLDERTIRWGIENDWLAPLAWGSISFDISLNKIPVVEGQGGLDYKEADLHRLMADHWSVMVETVRRLYKHDRYGLSKKQVFAVCNNVSNAESLAGAINALGVPSACVTGATSTVERNAVLAAYKAGEIRFISSVMVLREGWDAPNAEVCLMLRPTKSRVLYVQCMGRVLRKFRGKVALVLDALFQNTRFAPLSAPVLFGEPGQEVEDPGILVSPRRRDKKLAPRLPFNVKPKIVVLPALEIEFWAGGDGTFEADGEKWAHLPALCQILGLKVRTITGRLGSTVRRKKARGRQGKLIDFFCVADVSKVCADALSALLVPGTDGTCLVEGDTWGPAPVFAPRFGISSPTFRDKVIGNKNVRQKPGRARQGVVVPYYSLKDVERALGPISQLLRAGPEGTCLFEGEVWGPIVRLSQLLGINVQSVEERIQGKVFSREGKSWRGKVRPFFPLSKVRAACLDIVGENLLVAGGDGTCTFGGEVWGSKSSLGRILGVSATTVLHWICRGQVRSRKGIDKGGHPIDFFALKDLEVIRDGSKRVRNARGI